MPCYGKRFFLFSVTTAHMTILQERTFSARAPWGGRSATDPKQSRARQTRNAWVVRKSAVLRGGFFHVWPQGRDVRAAGPGERLEHLMGDEGSQQAERQPQAEPQGEAGAGQEPDYRALWEQAKADARKWEGRAKEANSKAC